MGDDTEYPREAHQAARANRVRLMPKEETFNQYLERMLSANGLGLYGHNEFDPAAEQACYQWALHCFYSTEKSLQEDDDATHASDTMPYRLGPNTPPPDPEPGPLSNRAGMAEDANPKDKAALSKVPMWSLPAIGAVHGAMATADGIRKGYIAYNWRYKSISMMEHIGALERHIAALKDGEDFTRDSDLGITHLGCMIAGASIILDAQQCGTLLDDRPRAGISTAGDTLEDYHGRNSESE